MKVNVLSVVLSGLIATSNFAIGQDNSCNFVNGGEFPTGENPTRVAVADLDGDFDVDIVVVNDGSSLLSLFFNNGDATFTSSSLESGGNQPRSVAIADMDGDLDLDIIVTLDTSVVQARTAVHRNDGSGDFEDPILNQVFWALPLQVGLAVGDLDGDLIPDVFSCGWHWRAFGAASSMIGDGKGQLTIQFDTIFDTFLQSDCALADIDGNDVLDAVVVDLDGKVRLMRNNGDANFEIESISPGIPYLQALTVGDFNGDLSIDIALVAAVSAWKASRVAVLLNNGNSFPLPPAEYLVNGYAVDIETGDVNGDSHPDLITVSDSNTVSVLSNDGMGNFAASASFEVGDNPRSVAVADFDGDLDLDIVTANHDSNDITILLNEPILLGDTNLDGSVDLLDVSLFAEVLAGNGYLAQADMNCDSVVDLLDIPLFIDAVLGNSP